MQLKRMRAWERPSLPVNLRYQPSWSSGLEDRWLRAPSSDARLLLYWRRDVMSSVVGTLRGMKVPDWLRQAFWQGAKRALRKGLPSSRKVCNDYYDIHARRGSCIAVLFPLKGVPASLETNFY